MSSRALVFDFATSKAEAVTDRTTAAFSPVWSANGALVVGSLDETNRTAGLLTANTHTRTVNEGPARGLDVPLAVGPGGSSYIVRAFENASSYSPGRSSLALVGADGARQTIATGEVTFVGWTNP